jgi:beta-lactamase regulating signal transducer with metallopeptidase domain
VAVASAPALADVAPSRVGATSATSATSEPPRRTDATMPAIAASATSADIDRAGSHAAVAPMTDAAGDRRPLALLTLWITGVVLCLLPVGLGRLRVRALERAARPLDDPEWHALLERLSLRLGLRRRVRLLVGSESAMPMTWGWRRPVVLLPSTAPLWHADRRRDVLLHELAHVVRRDCPSQLVAQVACALHWYNPLVWLAAARLRAERERACDDVVLRSGAPASRYAGHLLDVARALRPHAGAGLAALAMARPSQLEGRLLAVLDARRSRAATTASVVFRTWSVALVAAATLACVQPARAVVTAAAVDAVPIDAVPTDAAPMEVATMDATTMASTTVTATPIAAATVATTVADLSFSASPAGISSTASTSASASAAFGGGFALVVPAAGALSSCLDGDRSRDGSASVHVNSDTDARELTVRVRTGDCRVDFDAHGEITYAADLSEITGISRGGWVEITERSGGTTRMLEIRPGTGGALERRLTIDGDAHPYDESARRWVASVLLGLNARTGFMAEAHAKYLLANGGVPALLAYVPRVTGDYAQRVYLHLALAQPGLDAATTRRIVELAGAELDSDYELAQLLVDIASKQRLTPEAATAYVGAVRSIGSDYERRRALTALLASGALDRRSTAILLEAAGGIDSDYELAELLLDVSRRGLVDAAARPAFLAALGNIASDYERRRVLSAFAAQAEHRAEDVSAVIGLIEPVDSDYEKASFLVELAKQARLTAAFPAFVRALGTVSSDHEQRRVLSAVLDRGDLVDAQVRSLIDVAGAGLQSDYELAEFLIAVARKHRIEGDTRDAYLRAAEQVQGSYEYGRVMSAVRPQEGRASM